MHRLPLRSSTLISFPRMLACAMLVAVAGELSAQLPTTGSLAGRVTDATTGEPLQAISVVVPTAGVSVTNSSGLYRMDRIPVGPHRVRFRRMGFVPVDRDVTISAGAVQTLDVAFEPVPISLGEVVVFAASRSPERLVDAPAAISVVAPERIRDLAPLGQTPMLVADLPGVHVRQSGAFDFNLNTRGFNFTNNRRMLVLIDGRDTAVPLLGNQEWADLAVIEDATRVELVKGPGSALYGANAFGGVLSIITPQVRDAPGTRLSVTGGDPTTLRLDARQAVLSSDNNWGVRVTGGLLRGDSFDRSRTDTTAFREEYERAGDRTPSHPTPGYEFVPLRGQTTNAPLGVSTPAAGDIDPVRMGYGSLRIDRYLQRGNTLTLEGGVARMENLVSTLSSGRSQGEHATRPWSRLAWTGASHALFAYYNGRSGAGELLAVPSRNKDRSATLHIEGQFDRPFPNDRGLITAGASARRTTVNTFGSLLSERGDGTGTEYYALFSQVTLNATSNLSAIIGARADFGSRDPRQFSPKLGVRWSPLRDHSVRLTAARGYLVAPALIRFLQTPIGPPMDLTQLEGGLRASPLGPALAGVADGQLFTNSAAVPLLALGKEDLRPERVTSYEAGYKAQVKSLFVAVDAYVSKIDGFVSGLLPGVNPDYPIWTAPGEVPEPARAPIEEAVRGALGTGLARLADGSTAYVLSGGNAGRATERGVEFAVQWRRGAQWLVDANYAHYGFELEANSFFVGDSVLSNTPKASGNVAVTYMPPQGTRARVGVRLSEQFEWRSSLWIGTVPPLASVDVVLSHPVTPTLTASVVGTNMLDQQRFQFYGGSLVARRVMASMTWRP